MGQVIKAYLGLFLILLILLSGVGMIFALMDVLNAQNFLAQAVEQIENSNWDYEVIKECFTNAQEKDYVMEISMEGDGVEKNIIHQESELPEDISPYTICHVRLDYKVRFMFALANLDAQMEGCVI